MSLKSASAFQNNKTAVTAFNFLNQCGGDFLSDNLVKVTKERLHVHIGVKLEVKLIIWPWVAQFYL